MSSPVSYELVDDIGVITIDNPPVNAISHGVREGLVTAVAAAAKDDDIKALMLACKGRTWMAGADIKEFGKPFKEPSLPDVNQTLADSPTLIVAAMNGSPAYSSSPRCSWCCNLSNFIKLAFSVGVKK